MRWTLVIALALGGCSLFGDDPPDNTCSRQTDCFRAQGEHCEFDAGVCMPIDAAVIDAPAIDAEIDAEEIDAPVVSP